MQSSLTKKRQCFTNFGLILSLLLIEHVARVNVDKPPSSSYKLFCQSICIACIPPSITSSSPTQSCYTLQISLASSTAATKANFEKHRCQVSMIPNERMMGCFSSLVRCPSINVRCNTHGIQSFTSHSVIKLTIFWSLELASPNHRSQCCRLTSLSLPGPPPPEIRRPSSAMVSSMVSKG